MFLSPKAIPKRDGPFPKIHFWNHHLPKE